jgi:hypothetical protein
MRTDLFPTRVVVVALAVVVVGGLGAVVFLAAVQTPIPDALDRLIFSALGALSALLAKTTATVPDPTQVEVVNDPGSPVPVVGEHDPL